MTLYNVHAPETVEASDATRALRKAQAAVSVEPAPVEPPPPPAGGVALKVPGTGAVIFEDLLTEPNPSKLYGGQHSPASEGYEANGQDDPWIPRLTDDPSPFLPVGRTTLTGKFRRHRTAPGVQSLYDRGVNKATRTQTEAWTTTNNPSARPPGRYVIYYSFRPRYDLMPHVQASGGGITKYTQVFQFKSHGGGLGTHLPMSATVGSDGIKVIGEKMDGALVQSVVKLARGWTRAALVCDWRDNGWYEFWVVEGGQFVKKVQRVTGVEFLGGARSAFSPGLGPYHNMSLFNGTVSGQPRAEYACDYQDFQICRYEGS